MKTHANVLQKSNFKTANPPNFLSKIASDHSPTALLWSSGQKPAGSLQNGMFIPTRAHGSHYRVLGWISQQRGVTFEQLALLCSRSVRTIHRWVTGWQKEGLVSISGHVGHGRWVSLTNKGERLIGSGWPAVRPAGFVRQEHLWWINQVRITLERRNPDACWLSERVIAGRYQISPDGVMIDHESDTPRMCAVEVELTVKSKPRLQKILVHHHRVFDGVVYYCAPDVRRLMERMQHEGAVWTRKLVVRSLPEA